MLTQGPQPPPYDVVLMDLQMPEMDGITATKFLRADPRFQNLPIIAMTAHVLVEERQRCIEAGMNDHVTKPIDPDALFATLARWTHPASPNGAKPAGHAPPPAAEIPEIDGVDIASGLKRVADNKKLYRSLLGQFAEKQSDAADRMLNALQRGDIKLAEQIAHTVKGVSGNLGITKVQFSAARVERAFREKDPAVPTILSDFDTLLRQQIATIVEALHQTEPAQDGAATTGKFNPEAATAAAARLRNLLKESDAEAEEAYEELRNALGDQVKPETLNALAASIRDFDFDQALAKLDEISAETHITEGQATS
jgi:two-component system, sensor histidine kinase and response regulator